MTIDELIKRLNKNERIKAESDAKGIIVYNDSGAGGIVVYNDSGNVLLAIPFEATNFLEIVFNDQRPADSMGKASCEYVADQIEEYLQTPIEKRRCENKYAIVWDNDDDGTTNCLCKRDGNWCICKRRYGCFPNGALFTQKELDDLKKCNFALIDVLDKLKTRV